MEKKNLLIFGCVAVLVFALSFAIRAGWKPTGHFTPGGGTLEIVAAEPGSKIYINNAEEHETTTKNEKYSVSGFSEKTHSVAVSKKGYWPWTKNIFVSKGDVVHLEAFNLPLKPVLFTLSKEGSEYKSLSASFTRSTPPSQSKPLISFQKNYSSWIDKNVIFLSWLGAASSTPSFFCKEETCASRIEIVNAVENIFDLVFYPGRESAIIFSNEKGVYVIDINKEGTQNFQPVVFLSNARLLTATTTLYIKTDDSIKSVRF